MRTKLPLSMGQQEYWSGLPFPPPGNLPNSGIKPAFPVSPALQIDSLPLGYQEAQVHLYPFLYAICHIIIDIISSSIRCIWYRKGEDVKLSSMVNFRFSLLKNLPEFFFFLNLKKLLTRVAKIEKLMVLSYFFFHVLYKICEGDTNENMKS